MPMTVQSFQNLELLAKKLEVILHPAWHGDMSADAGVPLLQDKPAMTYLLRSEGEEYHYWLTHKKSNGDIHHRHFTIRLFPDGLFFANYRAPANERLDDFIRGALACKD